jgi:hypothetical protein
MSRVRVAGAAATMLLPVLLLVAACTTTTSGTGSGAGSGVGGSGGPAASAPATTGNFCADYSSLGQNPAAINPGSLGQQYVAHWQALAAEAPTAIKADVRTVADYLKAIIDGTVDASKAAAVGSAIGRIAVWIAQNCH